MKAVPDTIDSSQIKGTTYVCPLCKAQTSADEVDIGWVKCPMVNGKLICLGCCMDYQGVSRSPEFETHPYRDLFEEVSRATRRPVRELRFTCLQHQIDLLRSLIESTEDEAIAASAREALAEIFAIIGH